MRIIFGILLLLIGIVFLGAAGLTVPYVLSRAAVSGVVISDAAIEKLRGRDIAFDGGDAVIRYRAADGTFVYAALDAMAAPVPSAGETVDAVVDGDRGDHTVIVHPLGVWIVQTLGVALGLPALLAGILLLRRRRAFATVTSMGAAAGGANRPQTERSGMQAGVVDRGAMAATAAPPVITRQREIGPAPRRGDLSLGMVIMFLALLVAGLAIAYLLSGGDGPLR
jgi:hypothetical protein